MKIAIPVSGGALAAHFGHCERFSVFTVDGTIIRGREELTPPEHEPGAFPQFLRGKGVDVVIAGGMGQRAQSLFSQHGIRVVCGAGSGDPTKIVQEYVGGSLRTGENACDH